MEMWQKEMTEQEALFYVASMLARNTAEHVEAAGKYPGLGMNAQEVAAKNAQVATILGIYNRYVNVLHLAWSIPAPIQGGDSNGA